MFQGSCDSTWILVLRKDYLHQGRIKIYSSWLEPETRPINLLLHCIISLMREQRQFYSPVYGELSGIHLHLLESVWQDHPTSPQVGSSMSAFFCLSILSIKARTHTHTHTYMITLMHTHMYTHTHSHTLTHSYTHVRAHNSYRFTCTHTHAHCSVQFSRSVVSDSLQPHELQHARPPCPSPTPGVHSNSRLSSRWCHPVISSSVVPFSSCPQSLPASESFPMSQLFTCGGQSTGVSALASFLPKKSQGWSPSEWTGWISLQSKGLSRVFSNTTVQKHQFFSAQLSSQSNSHIHTWPQEIL